MTTLRRALKRLTPAVPKARNFQPQVENLEDRVVPSTAPINPDPGVHVDYHGGPVLTNVQVQSVFYGDTWADGGSNAQTANELNNFLSLIVQSSYMDTLSQYYQQDQNGNVTNVGYGQFMGSTVVNAGSPDFVSADDVANELINDINNGTLPSLDDSQNFYVVFLPPGAGTDTGFAGFHTSVVNPGSTPDNPTTSVIHYAIIQTPDATDADLPGSLNSITGTVGHELAEAITDPEGSGWFGASGYDAEVGDLAGNSNGLFGGYLIQAVWSNADSDAVLPDGAQWLIYTDQQGNTTGPTAGDVSYQMNANDTLNVDAPDGLLSDADNPFGNPLTAVVVDGPGNGQVAVNEDGSFTYTPNADFTGTDSFTFYITDGFDNTDTATATITVFDSTPVAGDVSYQMNATDTLTVDAPNGVLSNASDPLGNPLSAVVVNGPSNGQLTLNDDGSFVYTPNADFTGTDTFTFQATDGTFTSAPATATITVNPLAPVAGDVSYQVLQNGVLNVDAPNGVLSNASDPLGNPLSAVVVDGPSNGQLTLNNDGSFTYTPNAGFSGTDTFTFQATDGTSNSATATATVLVTDPTPIAGGVSYQVAANSVLTVTAPNGVLQSATDPFGNPLSAVVVNGPTNGQLTLNGDGSFTYTPNSGFSGTDTFTFQATDGTYTSAPATATIAVNAPPRINLTPALRLQVATIFTHSLEYDTTLVTATYQRYLHRTPSTAEEAGWITAVQNGLTDEVLEAGFLGSAEYLQGHGNGGVWWVQGLYKDVLGRTASADEVNGWLGILQAGMSPTQIAHSFTTSFEREANRISADYAHYLGRLASADEVNGWLAAVHEGLTQEDLAAAFASSAENFANHGNDAGTWLSGLYQDILGRLADASEIQGWLDSFPTT
jgi:hypothetical protein